MPRLFFALWFACLGMLQAQNSFFDTNGTTLPLTIEQAKMHKKGGAADTEQSVFTMQVSPQERHLYTTLASKPERLIKGEIFSITLRSIVTAENFQTLGYRFKGGRGLQLLDNTPERTYRDRVYYDTFYFKATGSHVVLPDITPYITFGLTYAADSDTIKGTPIELTVLNPPKTFCGVLAEHFSVTHAKTTVYDSDHNILVFMADANRSDLGDFSIPSALKQNFESLHSTPHASKMTYYAVLPKRVETLRFDYFNLRSQRYKRISIPIEVDDDLVSTMSDLKPVEHGHNYQKAVIFAGIAVLFFLAALWRRSLLFLLLALAAGGYAAWLTIPLRNVCIHKGAPIYLLPMRHATVFEITPVQYELEMQGHIKDYTKVRLTNNKIGWVKDEDTCAH